MLAPTATPSVVTPAAPAPKSGLVMHAGACHCGAVRFTVAAPADLVAWDCNCSICAMKRNVHAIVPSAQFTLVAGSDAITTYRFGTRRAVHQFCSVCGVQAFYTPRSNPDGVAVTVACLVPGTVRSVTVRRYDGQNWEEAHEETGIAACTGGAARGDPDVGAHAHAET